MEYKGRESVRLDQSDGDRLACPDLTDSENLAISMLFLCVLTLIVLSNLSVPPALLQLQHSVNQELLASSLKPLKVFKLFAPRLGNFP